VKQGIFRSTSQALHFAYIIQAYEVSAESVMAKAVRRLMKESGVWDTGEPSSIDFDGLSSLEVRAQCAMIRAAVRDHLPGPERWAIQARYGINEIVTKDGNKKAVFSRERYDAILNLSKWLAPSFKNFSLFAVDLLIARAVDRRVCNTTPREMAERFGISRDTFIRALHDTKKRLYVLEGAGIDRLTPIFAADGLVEPL
jgi:hypothetical protein